MLLEMAGYFLKSTLAISYGITLSFYIFSLNTHFSTILCDIHWIMIPIFSLFCTRTFRIWIVSSRTVLCIRRPLPPRRQLLRLPSACNISPLQSLRPPTSSPRKRLRVSSNQPSRGQAAPRPRPDDGAAQTRASAPRSPRPSPRGIPTPQMSVLQKWHDSLWIQLRRRFKRL